MKQGFSAVVLWQHECTPLSLTTLYHPIPANLKFDLYDHNCDFYRIEIPVEFKDCPLGFYVLNRCCECHPFLHKYHQFQCHIKTASISIPKQSWLGFVPFNGNKSFGFSSLCPSGYCKDGISTVNMTEQDSICESRRTGILCGGCAKEYSVVLGPDICRICNSNLWLLLIAVFIALGVFLVLGLFYLQLTISTQLLVGIIFFANITQVSLRSVYYEHVINTFLKILNLEVGFELCFYKGMTVTIKTFLQLLFPVYLWLLALMISLISRYSNMFANLTVNSSVQVLATLLYLSFSKLLLIVIDVFTPASVYTPNGTLTVWYTDGNVSYWNDTGHLILLIISFMLSVMYIIPFLIWGLLASYLPSKSSWTRKRHNFVDVFHGQYREGRGWWFGAHLFVLLMCSISFTMLKETNISALLLLNISILSPFVFTQIYFRPFKQEWVNLLDNFMVADLLIVEVTSLYSVDHNDVSYIHYVMPLLLSPIILISVLLVCVRCLHKFKHGKNLITLVEQLFLKKPDNQKTLIMTSPV